ncbi:MAG: M28 family peptidase [Sphingobacteriaceae bacterium]|nr:M28 family peptidase [Cytophagaceae bacterium]
MKFSVLPVVLAGCLLTNAAAFSQKPKKAVLPPRPPEFSLAQRDAEAHLRFLAADELMGRRTGEPGNLIAGRYIAEQFRVLGLKPAAGPDTFLQLVPFETVKPGNNGYLLAGVDTIRQKKDFIVFAGDGATLANAPVIFAGYGWVDAEKGQDDYKNLDVKGKIVVTTIGTPDAKNPGEIFGASEKKTALAAARGAAALIEIVALPFPWGTIVNYFGGESIRLAEEKTMASMPHLWVSGASKKLLPNTLSALSINVPGTERKPVRSFNVAGIVEGTDPVLKNEYVVLTAHHDHVGTGKNGGGNSTPADSIFNGARDNAFGTTAVLLAAKAFMQQRPKRSILFIAYTGEEIGLLGSKYYANHPLVPLKQSVFNLDCDGAGYNDTTKVTVIGLSRTDAKPQIEAGAKAFGLTAIDDPAPEQNLFDRSDNVSLAEKGIPAPDYAPGFTKFDAEIFKYYHQVTDNPDNVSFPYLLKYAQSFTHAARLIANRPTAPKWTPGDKYEKAAQALYGK